MDTKIAQWLVGRDTGSSSKAIVAELNGAMTSPDDHPHDPDDLGRCIRLLELMPEYRIRLREMRGVSPMWRNLVDQWDELVRLYHEELPTGKAPKCYDFMRELIQAGWKECNEMFPDRKRYYF